MSTDRPTPPPRGAGKAGILVAAVLGALVVITFVGFNLHHADTLRDQQAGEVKPSEVPLHEKDLQRTPVDRK